MAGYGLHIDRIIAAGGGDGGGSPQIGRFYGQGIVAGAEVDVQGLDIAVRDATVDGLTADHGVGAHAEPGDVVRRQNAGVVGRAVAVEDVQGIHLLAFDHVEVAVDRSVEVVVPGRRLLRFGNIRKQGGKHDPVADDLLDLVHRAPAVAVQDGE